jgi:peptide/nickel transport system ATP-binding protein
MAALLTIEGLRVTARDEAGTDTEIVRGVSLAVKAGEVMGLIGESGSGKTTIALATMGHTRFGCRISAGRIMLGDTDITALDERGLRGLRGKRIAYIAQSAAASFNPSRRIMPQVIEAARIHGTATQAEARAKAIGLFRALAVPEPETIGERYPHQVSGGQLQRLMAAMALITDPEVVIFDEPTTALDVTTQIEVLRAFKSAIRDRNTTGLYVTHDLAVIAQIADAITVLRHGEVQESGETARLISSPSHPYTQSLLAAAEPARREVPPAPAAPAPVIRVSGLVAGYGGIAANGEPVIPIVKDIAFSVEKGRALGVIGESGCGKSTLARVIAGLTPLARGSVSLDGRELAPAYTSRSRDDLRRIQLVFQMADTALNPMSSVRDIIGRPLAFYFGLKGAALDARIRRLLDLTKLPASVLDRKPGDLSGGQKQRVNLARALAAEPDLLLCDEVTSALDTVVAAAILDLLTELRRELGLTYVFISHDLKTIRAVCDEVMVLYAGRMVETMKADAIERPGHHPYADLLFSSVPELRQGWLEDGPVQRANAASPAGISDELRAGQGCPFTPRCPKAIPGLCGATMPALLTQPDGTLIACHWMERERALMPSSIS